MGLTLGVPWTCPPLSTQPLQTFSHCIPWCRGQDCAHSHHLHSSSKYFFSLEALILLSNFHPLSLSFFLSFFLYLSPRLLPSLYPHVPGGDHSAPARGPGAQAADHRVHRIHHLHLPGISLKGGPTKMSLKYVFFSPNKSDFEF